MYPTIDYNFGVINGENHSSTSILPLPSQDSPDSAGPYLPLDFFNNVTMALLELFPRTATTELVWAYAALHRNHGDERFREGRIASELLPDKFQVPVTTVAVGWPRPLIRQIVNQLSVEKGSQFVEEESQCGRVS